MKSAASFLIRCILTISVIFQLSSCDENCDERAPVKPLKEIEKAFIADQAGDTLHFKDTTGKKYFLVCKSKELSTSGYYHTGHLDPCDDTIVEWEKLAAQFEGNLLNDKNLPLSFQSRIEGGHQPADPGGFDLSNSCNSNYRSFFYLIFNIPQPSYSSQVYWGRTDENLLPVVINYGLKMDATIGGHKYPKLLTNGISNNCLGNKPNSVGLDSVYYSPEFGLVRVTTKGGKKYQRVL